MAGKAIRLSPPHMAHGHNTPMGWAKGALSPQGLAQTGHLVPVTLLPTSSVSVHVFRLGSHRDQSRRASITRPGPCPAGCCEESREVIIWGLS